MGWQRNPISDVRVWAAFPGIGAGARDVLSAPASGEYAVVPTVRRQIDRRENATIEPKQPANESTMGKGG
jgi:hypothetical protein